MLEVPLMWAALNLIISLLLGKSLNILSKMNDPNSTTQRRRNIENTPLQEALLTCTLDQLPNWSQSQNQERPPPSKHLKHWHNLICPSLTLCNACWHNIHIHILMTRHGPLSGSQNCQVWSWPCNVESSGWYVISLNGWISPFFWPKIQQYHPDHNSQEAEGWKLTCNSVQQAMNHWSVKVADRLGF